MAFCVKDCIDFDESFTDSDSEYEDSSGSSTSQINVYHEDPKSNPLQPRQHAVKDILAFMKLSETHRRKHASRTNFSRVYLGECQVCLCEGRIFCRPCCRFVLCKACFQSYVAEKIKLGITEIECPNTCIYLINPDDIVNISSLKFQQKYRVLQMTKMRTSLWKECFCCGNLIYSQDAVSDSKKGRKLICSCCGVMLCASCFHPWHQGVSCKQNQKGDTLLKSWAKGYLPGQPKAQKCPKCKIYIERISGCDHINCTKCGTSFCYRCGEAFRSWKAFGDHSSKLSVFGCKYAFLPNKPFCRKLIRGSLFSTRVFATIIVGTLAIGVGSAAVCVGVASLPFYGVVRLCQKLKRKKKSTIPESVGRASPPLNCYLIRKVSNISEETEYWENY